MEVDYAKASGWIGLSLDTPIFLLWFEQEMSKLKSAQAKKRIRVSPLSRPSDSRADKSHDVAERDKADTEATPFHFRSTINLGPGATAC